MGPEMTTSKPQAVHPKLTVASRLEMSGPGALAFLSPLVAGLGFGKECCAGLLSGALISSVQLAVSMGNPGVAWDNSKKHISAGGLGKEFVKGSKAHKKTVTGVTESDPLKEFVKGSESHKNPVSGGTVGDPLKGHKKCDTVGDPLKEFVKGSEAPKNSVSGETVGDPLKDTSGPALYIFGESIGMVAEVFEGVCTDLPPAKRRA
jgi:Na+/H+-translocating membrane pyrophosphatase